MIVLSRHRVLPNGGGGTLSSCDKQCLIASIGNMCEWQSVSSSTGDLSMRKHLSFASLILLVSNVLAFAQGPAPSPQSVPPASTRTQAPPVADQLTPQVLAEMLRSATT